MKKIINKKDKDDLIPFLVSIIGEKAKRAAQYLKLYRIEKKSQLIGIAQRRVPKMSVKSAQTKGVAKSYLNNQLRQASEQIIAQLRKAMHISGNDANKIYKVCINETSGIQHYNFNSGWAFGLVRTRNKLVSSRNFWRQASKIRISGGFYIVPQYESAGPVFDQGERGTCVANSICTLMNYETGSEWSRQFMHHQSKMVDGKPQEEGTFIETVVEVITEGHFQDFGNIRENVWPYNPFVGKTIYQGPPPERSYSTERIFTSSQAVFARESSLLNDVKYLLNDKKNGKASLVAIGIAIHESFFSYNTADTGWVTMPLPGEAIVGYHAMTVCGYDDERQLFLVRNSWGPHWAHNNDKGYNGHAWIPYRYIEKYCHVAVSLGDLKSAHMLIPEEDRLYHRVVTRQYAGELAAGRNKRKKYSGKKYRRISIGGWLLRIAVLLIIWHAYKEPILKTTVNLRTRFEENLNLNEVRNVISDLKEKINN